MLNVQPVLGFPTECDLPSSLLQVRDAVVATSIAGAGFAFVAAFALMARNNKQKQ